MSRRGSLPGSHLLLALLAGGVAVAFILGVMAAVQHQAASPAGQQRSKPPPPGDLVRTMAAGLRRSHFYVSPALRDRVTAPQQRAIEHALTDHPDRPTRYLAWLTDTDDGGYATNSDAMQQVADLIGHRGLYVVVNESMNPEELEVGVGSDYVDSTVLEQRPGDGLLAYARLMGSDIVPQTPSGGGEVAGPVVVGLFVGLTALALLLAVATWVGKLSWLLGGSAR